MRAELERLVEALEARTETKDNYRIAVENGRWEAAQLIRQRILTRSDWIPVSERLPPEGKLRLVQVLNLSDPDDMCCAYLWRGDWLMQTPDDMPDAIVHGVIAWQGLPAPYRAEGGGT